MERNKERNLIKFVIKTIANVLIIFILFLSVFALYVTITSKKDSDGASNIFGYELRFVKSDSMGESEYTDVSGYKIGSIPIKSLVVVKVKPEDNNELKTWYEGIEVGDVLTFKYLYNKQETITHRVTKIEKNENNGYNIYLEGDNKASENKETLTQVIDTSLENSPNYIIGEVVFKSEILGNFIYLLSNPIGIICLIIVPCLVIIILEIIKIINVLNKNKTESELIKLKKKLEELEKVSEE